MERNPASLPRQSNASGRRYAWPWLLVAGGVLVILLGILTPKNKQLADGTSAASALRTNDPSRNQPHPPEHRTRHYTRATAAADPQSVVVDKVSRFARRRLEIVQAMAAHYQLTVPPEVEQLFAAAEAGRWDELKERFSALKEMRNSSPGTNALTKLWPAIVETYGVAEVAHNWPPQKLLDYGEAVLGVLSPGMVFVGATEAGRFIPTLLNETSEGPSHVVFTQNALAEGSYTDYLRFLYKDRLALISAADSQQTFANYIADAKKRLLHDQQFPDQPKQIRPGEDVRVTDNRVQVAGQVAVMAINERLLQLLMEKNPGLQFAMEESFPLKSTHKQAMPLGPILQLGMPDAEKNFNAAMAARSVEYWRSASQSLLADTAAPGGNEALAAYSKMAEAQARLLEDHQFSAEAEENYRVAVELAPTSASAVYSYIALLTGQNRLAEASSVAENALRAAPENTQLKALVESLKTTAQKR